jgi:hypothetical protein
MADFQKGERYVILPLSSTSGSLKYIYRQMNIDYSICNALKYNTDGMTEGLVIYDIGCQWWINFLRRLRENRHHLSIPNMMTIITAVGSFHLSAHISECFVLYSLHFVLGSGQLDGEILETLWAEFNRISSSARSMSAAHRREVYDDHMRDSNWKKLIGMCESMRIFN